MRFHTFGYYISEALKGARRGISLMSLSTIVASFFILGSLALVFVNLDYLSRSLVSRVEIRVFLKNGLSPSQIKNLQSKLEALPEVKSLDFISKDEGLKALKAQLKDKQFLFDVLEENPLPDAIDIKLKDPRKAASLAGTIEAFAGVESVNYGKGFAEALFAATRFIGVIAVAFFAIMTSLLVFIIGNAVRLSIFSRRREIEIARLIGATDWFIRWPFILEGIVIGMSGAAISCLVLYAGYQACLRYLNSGAPFIPVVTDRLIIGLTCLGLVGIGALMGAVASWGFTRRYLKA